MPGHVFVVHADLTKLACDYYLVPTDRGLDVGDHWNRFGEPPRPLPEGWGSDRVRVTTRRQLDDGVAVRWVNTGSVPDADPVSWLEDGVRQALDRAAEDLQDNAGGRYRRGRPLVGVPVFGTGEGGYAHVRGKVLDMLLRVTNEVVRTASYDIAIVCRQRSDYAAVQSRSARLESSGTALGAAQVETADMLGEQARAGRLVLFLGAGISIPAGLPSWPELIGRLADDSEEWRGSAELLRKVEHPDAATVLYQLLGPRFHSVLATALRRSEYALGHALLASLQIGEVVTTNFDDLYEQAAAIAFEPRELRVLPWQRVAPGMPWLLKLHGGIDHDHVVFTREDYLKFDERWQPLASIVQTLLMTRHMLFVGYSLTDENFVRLGRGVSRLLRQAAADQTAPEGQLIGTVLTLLGEPPLDEAWSLDLKSVAASDDASGDGADANAARQLEIFLDRVAAQAASDERSYVLDPRYVDLVEPRDREVVDHLADLTEALAEAGPTWGLLREVLRSYGALA